ncbi:uncharacterized protein RJT21DRAFT_115612 [Scheffersomyces amazonensis]|uniref:uncharacterized protein n=1 Tax=Scheffersomyces amazonensis TaxID=1078765 RepID=UPI00315C87A9
MILDDYFACVSQSQHRIANLYKELELSDHDIYGNDFWKIRVMELDWDSNYSNYHQNENGDYIHNLFPSIIIPQSVYNARQILREKCRVSRDLSVFQKPYLIRHDARLETKNSFFKWYQHHLTDLFTEISIYQFL